MLFLKSCIFNLLLLLSFVWAAPTISKRSHDESVLPRGVTSIQTLNVKREVELSNYLQRRGNQHSLSIRSAADMEDNQLSKRADLERRSPKSIFTKIKEGFQKFGQKVKSGFQKAGAAIKKGFQKAGQAIKGAAQKVGKWVKDHKDAIIKGVTTAVKIASKFIKRTFGSYSVEPETR